MRRPPIGLLAATLLACAPSIPPLRLAPTVPPRPWQDLDRTCARSDNPRHHERTFVGDQRREQLIVPVTIHPALTVPRMWVATGGEEPDITPFRWGRPRLASETAGRSMALSVKHESRDTLALELRLHTLSVSGVVTLARIERRPTGELVGTLAASWFTDIPPWGGHFSELAGEIRLSDETWDDPGELLAVHLEVGSGQSILCAQFQVAVPPPGESRQSSIPYTLAETPARSR